MGKTKRKRRPSSEQKQTKEQLPQGWVQGGIRFSRGQQRTERKEKTYFHKTKTSRGESAAALFQKCKEAFVLYNEESDDEE